MNKVVVLIFLSVFLAAQNATIEFLETRYIEALNEKVTKKGEVEFGANHTLIRYLPPNQREITLKNGIVTLQTKDSIVQKSAKEEQNIVYMFTVFKAAFDNNETELKKFFKITKDDTDTVLTPFSTSSPVSKMTFSRSREKIKKIEIFSWDDSRITIDVVEKK
ncbi:MAG: hypothetical protein LBF71_02885 [Campylobacteraceae bacterium]|jgi:hypothetical protein|nr:hypothetical protein [Campylobacteraceae bacterium]